MHGIPRARSMRETVKARIYSRVHPRIGVKTGTVRGMERKKFLGRVRGKEKEVRGLTIVLQTG